MFGIGGKGVALDEIGGNGALLFFLADALIGLLAVSSNGLLCKLLVEPLSDFLSARPGRGNALPSL